MPSRPLSLEAAEPMGPPKHARAFVIVLVMALLHAWAVWGYSGIFWGDHGRWLHAVARFAEGEVPYRDFTYNNPPFALWIVGGLARLLGSTFAAISAIMTSLYLLICVVFLLSLRRLVPDLVLPIAVPSFVFAVSYAFRHGVSLPAGTDSPAAPIGFICVLGAAWCMLETVERPTVAKAAGAGVLLGFGMLSRHDFWPACVYLLAAGGVFLSQRKAPARVQGTIPIVFGITLLAGTLITISSAGWAPASHAFVNWERAVESFCMGLPSIERVVAEVAGAAALSLTAVTALWICLAVSDRVAARWAGVLLLILLTAAAVHLGTSVAIGQDLAVSGLPDLPTITQEALWRQLQRGRGMVSAAIALFDSRLQAHLFPVILPPIVLGVLLARWRKWHDPVLRGRLALLLGLCIMARTRRGFGGADWYNVMLEIPAYAVFLQLVCGPARQKAARTVRAALSVLILIAFYTYISLAVGPLTFHGTLPRTLTRNGVVRWPIPAAIAYQTADRMMQSVDALSHRPAYAFGASGGWNFFLLRRNPLGFTDGMPSPDPVGAARQTARLRAANPLLVDNRYALRQIQGLPNLFSWEPPAMPNRFIHRDRPWFESVIRNCTALGDGDSTAMITVYDCGNR